jgi:hypothetical protein
MKRQSKTFSSSGKDCNQIPSMLQKGTLGGYRDKAQQRALTSSTKGINTSLVNNTVPNRNELNGLS